jgi:phosphoserine aminotransferase
LQKEESFTVTSSTLSAQSAKRLFNFNAGPGALPLPVLERIREELLDWRGSGMSVMEMSHRSPEFESVIAGAEQKLRSLLGISDDYAVIFLQGGGSMQFTMVPMNLCLRGKPVDVLHTGMWTAKAIGELKKGVLHNIAASTESEKFSRLRTKSSFHLTPPTSIFAPTTPSKALNGPRCRRLAMSRSSPTCLLTSPRARST